LVVIVVVSLLAPPSFVAKALAFPHLVGDASYVQIGDCLASLGQPLL
jgi:hypothetical protein